MSAVAREFVDVPAPPVSETRLRTVPPAPGMTAADAVAKYMPLVHKLARRALRPGLDLEDLVSEGTIGLLIAAQRWRDDGGATFLSFAYTHVFYRLVRITRRARWRGLRGTDSAKTIADVISLDAPIETENGDGSLHDVIGESEENELVTADALERLRAAVESLDEDDRAFVAARFDGQTLAEIGAAAGRSREVTRQRELGVIDRLRPQLAKAPGVRPTRRRRRGECRRLDHLDR